MNKRPTLQNPMVQKTTAVAVHRSGCLPLYSKHKEKATGLNALTPTVRVSVMPGVGAFCWKALDAKVSANGYKVLQSDYFFPLMNSFYTDGE